MTSILRKRVHEQALPFRQGYDSPAGYDIAGVHILSRKNSVEETITYVGTGWSLEIPETHYVEIHERSSLHKTGFGLANKVGIIDSDYRGELILALRSNTELDPPLGTYMVQLIPRRKEPVIWVDSDDISETKRGKGGFGSSD